MCFLGSLSNQSDESSTPVRKCFVFSDNNYCIQEEGRMRNRYKYITTDYTYIHNTIQLLREMKDL